MTTLNTDVLRAERLVAALAYAAAAVAFNLAYVTTAYTIVATLVALAVALVVSALTRHRPLAEYGVALVAVGVPLAYETGVGPASHFGVSGKRCLHPISLGHSEEILAPSLGRGQPPVLLR